MDKISRLDYFAAHAPDVPAWFDTELHTPMPVYNGPEHPLYDPLYGFSFKQQSKAAQIGDNEKFCKYMNFTEDQTIAYMHKIQDYKHERRKYEELKEQWYKKQSDYRYFKWRIYYANRMVNINES